MTDDYRFFAAVKAKNRNIFAAPNPTVAFLGDSVTQGCFSVYQTGETTLETEYDYKKSPSEYFRSLLSLLFPRVQCNVINAGISGDTAPGGSARLDRDIFAYHPHLLVVSYGLNDCGHDMDGLAAFTNSLRRIFRRVREENLETVFITPNMMCTYVSYDITSVFFRKIAENFVRLQTTGVLDAYVDAARNVCTEEGIPVCDVYSRWQVMFRNGCDVTRLLANRMNHPIPELNRMTASLLLEKIHGEKPVF